ncbi:hypothetical protein BGX38DRAFT_1280724 [Terfezia claveryi]|nr:hypothetical protein BGX38DRAFT_1280724 [Terfezia claveryi]
MPPRRPASSPAAGDPGSQKVRIHKTIPAVNEGAARMSRQTAGGYQVKLLSALMAHVGPETDHKCSHVLLGTNDFVLDQEQLYMVTCETTFLEAKLRELGITLLSDLFGVKHPNTIDSWIDGRGLLPQQHFKSWIGTLSDKGECIFKFTPPIDARKWSPPQIFGSARYITVGQLADGLQALSGTTNIANKLVHSLTVNDVVHLLTRHNMENKLGQGPSRKIKALVVAILGQPLSQPNRADLPKSFKTLVRIFRTKVQASTFITKIEREWKKEYDDALRVERTEDMIRRGLVVSRIEHDQLRTEQRHLEAKYNHLEAKYNHLGTTYKSLETRYKALEAENKGLKADQQAQAARLLAMEGLETRHKALEAENKGLKANQQAQAARLLAMEGLETRHKALEAENKELKANQQAQAARLLAMEGLETRHKALEAENKELKANQQAQAAVCSLPTAFMVIH